MPPHYPHYSNEVNLDELASPSFFSSAPLALSMCMKLASLIIFEKTPFSESNHVSQMQAIPMFISSIICKKFCNFDSFKMDHTFHTSAKVFFDEVFTESFLHSKESLFSFSLDVRCILDTYANDSNDHKVLYPHQHSLHTCN